jgi:hypothetical protein
VQKSKFPRCSCYRSSIQCVFILQFTSGADYVQMPGQERLKDRPAGGFKHFLHSLVPSRSRSPSPSPNRPTTPTLDPQASSTPVGFKHFFHSLVPGRNKSPSPPPNRPITPLNSPSSNIYPSIVIKPGEGKSDLASTVFQGVKTTLRLVEMAADAFPPLKLAVTGLLGDIDIVEVRDFQLSVL